MPVQWYTLPPRFIDLTIRHLAWDFAFTPEADTAVYFQIASPLWLWDGAESDRLRHPESEESSQWVPLAA